MSARILRWTVIAFLVLLVNSFYLFSFALPTVFYMSNVLLHVVLGAVLFAVFVWGLSVSSEFRQRVRFAAIPLLIAAVLGFVLVKTGALFEYRYVLWSHVGVSLFGAALLLPTAKVPALRWTYMLGLAGCLAAMGVGAMIPDASATIRNPLIVPTAMTEEGGGTKSPFWPSSAKTNVGGYIPSNFFMDSKVCGECHQDIYKQWQSSMHHFSSMNNQFYRKTIEHMQDISGTQGSKWCAGCHDHAMFFNGRFERPAKDQVDTPEAQNGLGCVSCHSIVHVDSTMGNAGHTMMYPPLHKLAVSDNPIIHGLDRFLTFTDPEPHRRVFMKSFMREQPAEFCSTCHKVHLDEPVNHYRWLRGTNDYDNWQASGVSGQGARSFYYPAKSMDCSSCHMPLVPSKDPGNRNGMVHNHRFAAANTAVPTANRDEAQLKAVEGFLQSGFISIDIFAASPEQSSLGAQMIRRAGDNGPALASTMAVGEEGDSASSPAFLREVGKVAAPLDQAGLKVQPGSTIRMDVVVRTRKIGHFFPGGTTDSPDLWIELQGRDAAGKVIYWSGQAAENGNGEVEPGAHFYRSFLLDGAGNPVTKRNAWQARSVLYSRLIGPGAADVAHYRVPIPKTVKGPLTFTAKLNYRKFTPYYTRFSYAGKPQADGTGDQVGLAYDSRAYDFSKTNIPKNVSGSVKDEIPVLPTMVLSKSQVTLMTGDAKTPPEWKPVLRKMDRERWNDWGIGLLLQGDLKGAEYAFTRVTDADPDYADGWLNIARALIQEGETDAAKQYIDEALKRDSSLPRIYFFRAMIEKADGDYDACLVSLRKVVEKYPRDRVVQNQIGRILFLKRDYTNAIQAFQQVLAIDPEDIQAHYSLMLCYKGLGDDARAAREEALFRRFKADESSQVITARRRMISPEDNNERQPVHEHDSVTLQ